jgi:hypothetical protein
MERKEMKGSGSFVQDVNAERPNGKSASSILKRGAE